MSARELSTEFCCRIMSVIDDQHALIRLLGELDDIDPSGEHVNNALFDAHFFIDAPMLPELQARVDAADKLGKLQKAVSAAMGDSLEGLELANSTSTLFAVFLRDASNPGMVRYQVFKENGFYSHSTHADWDSALEDAYYSGFTTIIQGRLEALSAQVDFLMGMDNFEKARKALSGGARG